MNRRVFLKRGLLGGAVLALSGLGISLQPSRRMGSPSAPLRVLGDSAFQVMAAIAARMVALPDADPLVIAERVDLALTRAAPEAAADLQAVLGLFENALPGLLLDGRARPFTRLDPAAQDRVLEAWKNSRLVLRRGAYQAIRKMCLASYYVDPATWREIRYPGPPVLGGMFYDDSKAGSKVPS